MGKRPEKAGGTTDQKETAKEQREREQNEKIVAAINRVADEKRTDNDENNPKEKGKRCREIATIISIIFGSCVALIAVYISHKDSSDQIASLRSQLDLLKAGQRPWVSILAPSPIGSFSWDNTGGRITAGIQIKNVGKNPAFDVAVETQAAFLGMHTTDLAMQLNVFCADVQKRRSAKRGKGDVIFPDESAPHSEMMLWPEATVQQQIKELGIPFFGPAVLICAAYRDAIKDEWHSTGFVYLLLTKPASSGALPLMVPTDKGDIPNDSLFLARFPFGSFAD